jgi:outer membrane lipoprotein-sorting protein
VASLTGDPKASGPPLATLLRPTWLLTGFALENDGPVTACGREALRVVATPRQGIRRDPTARRDQPLDRIEVIVDAELGILLRHEEIFQGQPLSLTELVSVSFDPAQAGDDAQFQPPSGWAAAEKNAKPTPPDVLSSDLVNFTMVLMGGGLGALIKPSLSDPFGQATREEPETAMPEDEPIPPGALPVSDEVLHLLHASQVRQVLGIEATLHGWTDITALLARAPDRVPRAGLSRIGSLVDAAGQRIPTEHTVTRLRIAGPDRYRIDELAGPKARARPVTTVCDGERCWSIFADKVKVGPTAPPRGEIANLLDPSWLLEARLTGGTETVIGGRRGYRLAVAPDYPHRIPMYSPDEVVVDAELGVLLSWITRRGPRTLMRYELRDVTPYSGEPGDLQPDLPPGIRVIEEDPDDGVPPVPDGTPSALAGFLARQAAKEARSAVQGFVDFIRGGDAR